MSLTHVRVDVVDLVRRRPDLHERSTMQTTSQLVHDPDGVPHRTVGMTLMLTFAAAAACFAALTAGTFAQLLLALSVPPVLIALARQAARVRA